MKFTELYFVYGDRSFAQFRVSNTGDRNTNQNLVA
jgi:hypothetical protein